MDMNVREEIKRRRRREKRGSADGALLVYVYGTPKYRDTSTPVEYVDHDRLR